MNVETLARMLAALAVMHAFHAIGEMANVRFKGRKLRATIENTPIQEKAFKIDTTAKIVAVQMVMIIVLFGGSFLVFGWLQLAATTLVAIAIGLIIIVEIATTIGYDKYHNEIGTEISRLRQMKD